MNRTSKPPLSHSARVILRGIGSFVQPPPIFQVRRWQEKRSDELRDLAGKNGSARITLIVQEERLHFGGVIQPCGFHGLPANVENGSGLGKSDVAPRALAVGLPLFPGRVASRVAKSTHPDGDFKEATICSAVRFFCQEVRSRV